MKWIRRLYDWVLSWADTPYGTPALGVLSSSEASFSAIPPDVLLIALCIGQRRKALWFAWVCSIASLFGGIAGYAIGWGVWAAVDQLFFNYVPGFTPEAFAQVQGLYEKYNFWIVFVAAFTPIPYKVITIGAGVFGVSFIPFLIASAVGRAARFFLVATLLYFLGEPIREFIDRWFNLCVVAFTVLLIGGFALIKWLH